jgi:hypothetical protein
MWSPDPPPEFARFYAAFLAWRASNGWANDIADRLPELFTSAGLVNVETVTSDETVDRGGPDVWGQVIEGLGRQFYPEDERAAAAVTYHDYCQTVLQRQTLSLRTVIGRRLP